MRAAKSLRTVLLIYGLLNAALYCSLLPLWEGFDEEFHYGYVQYLDAHFRLPVQGVTPLSDEINRSFSLLPMSHVMIDNLHLKGVRTFDEYFALDPAARESLYAQAHLIPVGLRRSESLQFYLNYEAHHAPLAYFLMAVPDRVLSGMGILWRVWILRLLISVVGALLMLSGMLALAAEFRLDRGFAAALVFLIFSCQMFWASVAHVANDWLAVPLAVWLIVWALRYRQNPSPHEAFWLALVMGLGLLSKAYFLVFVPLYLVAVIWYGRPRRLKTLAALLAIPLLLAGPWYLRNLLLYKNLSGRVEETAGVTTAAAVKALVSIPWAKSIPFMARGALWMGNSTFSDFSVVTMDAVLLLLAIAVILFFKYRRPGDVYLWAPVALFCCAMIYVAGSSYAYTNGEKNVASPWYMQAVMAPFLCMAMLGCQRSGRLGSWLARFTVLLWGYVLVVTYVAKLFPLYGGFSGGRSTLHDIARWYLKDWARTSDILSSTAMLPAPWLWGMLGVLLVGAGAAVSLLMCELGSISKRTLR